MSEAFHRINWVDVLIVILLIRTSYIGAKTGLSTEIFKIVGVLLGLYFGIKYYSVVGSWMSSKISLPQEVSEGAAFLILVLVSMLSLKLVTWGLEKIVKLTFADKLNKWGGFIIGLLRGGIVLSLLFMFFGIIQVDYLVKSVEERSLTGPLVQKIAPVTYQAITEASLQDFQIRMPGSPADKPSKAGEEK